MYSDYILDYLKQDREAVGSYVESDTGNSLRFVERFKDELRYCPGLGWLAWSGKCFKEYEGIGIEYAKLMAKEMLDSAAGNEAIDWARGTQSRYSLFALVDLAKSDSLMATSMDDLDHNTSLLNVRNGELNLQKMELQPHNRKSIFTKLVDIDYDPDARCHFWDEFLDTIMGNDRDMTDLLQRLAGYSLTCDVSERKIFVALGEGANGKTTFLETLALLAGDYACKMPLDSLLERPKGNIPNDIAQLRGARFAYASESPSNGKLDAARIKELTGGDRIKARFMHKEFFTFAPTHKLWFATNHKPEVSGEDTAVWDRMIILPFEHRIPSEKRLMKTEVDRRILAELPGILRWAAEGAYMWFEDGLAIPQKVTDAIAAYRDEMDLTGRFIESVCYQVPDAKCGATVLYDAYKDYCKKVGEKPVDQRSFSAQIQKKGFQKCRVTGGIIYQGIGVSVLGPVN